MMLRLAAEGVAGRAASALVVLVSSMVWSRLLQPEHYATYTLVVAAAGILQALLFNWIGATLLRLMPSGGDRQGDHQAAAILMFLAVAGLLLPGFALAGLVLGARVAPSLLVYALALTVLGGWLQITMNVSLARLQILHNTSRARARRRVPGHLSASSKRRRPILYPECGGERRNPCPHSSTASAPAS